MQFMQNYTFCIQATGATLPDTEWDSQLGGSDLEIVKTGLSAIVKNRLISECISGTHPIFMSAIDIPLPVDILKELKWTIQISDTIL